MVPSYFFAGTVRQLGSRDGRSQQRQRVAQSHEVGRVRLDLSDRTIIFVWRAKLTDE